MPLYYFKLKNGREIVQVGKNKDQARASANQEHGEKNIVTCRLATIKDCC